MKHKFNAWKNVQDAIGVFCNLSKAFDCVEHNALFLKPRHYGVNGLAWELIVSNLKDRIQHFDINGARSSRLVNLEDHAPLPCGMPIILWAFRRALY